MTKTSYEEHEHSYFYQFIQDYISGKKYKKVDKTIILNTNLTHNDLAIYLGILYCSSYKPKFYQKISSEQLLTLTGIKQTNQSRSIKKLEEYDYIKVYRDRYESSFRIDLSPKKYLPLSLEQFKFLHQDVKGYVRKLRALMLSNGNNRIPHYKTCKENCNNKLTREEYRKMKKIYDRYKGDEDIDITIYSSLEY